MEIASRSMAEVRRLVAPLLEELSVGPEDWRRVVAEAAYRQLSATELRMRCDMTRFLDLAGYDAPDPWLTEEEVRGEASEGAGGETTSQIV